MYHIFHVNYRFNEYRLDFVIIKLERYFYSRPFYFAIKYFNN